MSSYQLFQDCPKIRKTKHRGRFDLKCTAQANYPPPLITWKLDNGPEILGTFFTSLYLLFAVLGLSQSGWSTDICPVHSSVPTHTWRQGICLECNVDYSSCGGQGDGDVLGPPSSTLHTASQGFCHTQRWKGWVRLVSFVSWSFVRFRLVLGEQQNRKQGKYWGFFHEKVPLSVQVARVLKLKNNQYYQYQFSFYFHFFNWSRSCQWSINQSINPFCHSKEAPPYNQLTETPPSLLNTRKNNNCC